MLMFFKNLGKKVKSRKGYTLTELIVVVAILGILAAVATPMVLGQIEKSRESADKANAKTIENAIAIYMTTNERTLPISDKTTALTYINGQLGTCPTPQVSGNRFIVNLSTGKVKLTTIAAISGEVEVP